MRWSEMNDMGFVASVRLTFWWCVRRIIYFRWSWVVKPRWCWWDGWMLGADEASGHPGWDWVEWREITSCYLGMVYNSTYELFISGNFRLIFSSHTWLQVTETVESKTEDKGRLLESRRKNILCESAFNYLNIWSVFFHGVLKINFINLFAIYSFAKKEWKRT